jgi:hypothetical protein
MKVDRALVLPRERDFRAFWARYGASRRIINFFAPREAVR